jgi:hypothetical protein
MWLKIKEIKKKQKQKQNTWIEERAKYILSLIFIICESSNNIGSEINRNFYKIYTIYFNYFIKITIIIFILKSI